MSFISGEQENTSLKMKGTGENKGNFREHRKIKILTGEQGKI